MKAQAAPKAAAPTDRERARSATRAARVEGEADQRDAEAAEIGLALAADVEQAGMEGDGDREAGEDEVGGVEEREADALAVAERALDQDAAPPRAGSRR